MLEDARLPLQLHRPCLPSSFDGLEMLEGIGTEVPAPLAHADAWDRRRAAGRRQELPDADEEVAEVDDVSGFSFDESTAAAAWSWGQEVVQVVEGMLEAHPRRRRRR